MKYGRDVAVARFLGEKLAEAWIESANFADAVVPVPLHWTRKVSRGFNQAELMAGIFSARALMPVRKLLKRAVMTPKQARMGREQRRRNMEGAFRVDAASACEGMSLLLLDDVLTTGATLASASEALLEAGAKDVRVIVAARA